MPITIRLIKNRHVIDESIECDTDNNSIRIHEKSIKMITIALMLLDLLRKRTTRLPPKPPKPSDVKSIPRPTASVLIISFAKIGSIPCVNGVTIIQIVDLENNIN